MLQGIQTLWVLPESSPRGGDSKRGKLSAKTEDFLFFLSNKRPGRLGGKRGVMQPDLRFIDRVTKKPSKRNRGLILKYTVFAVLSCKHPASLQIFSKIPNEYIFFGGEFSFFFS